jgi:protein gp37
MYRDMKRYGKEPTDVHRTSKKTFTAPLRWAKQLGGPRLVFICSWSDMFIEEADAWRDEIWDIIWRTPEITYQILTKRPERIFECLPKNWGSGWHNVWLGVTVEQQGLVYRIKELIQTPSVVWFASFEPLLGGLEIPYVYTSLLDWAIVGGESGPNARPMSMLDATQLVRWLEYCEVPVFFKQWGAKAKRDGSYGGREICGRTWDEMPRVWDRPHIK